MYFIVTQGKIYWSFMLQNYQPSSFVIAFVRHISRMETYICLHGLHPMSDLKQLRPCLNVFEDTNVYAVTHIGPTIQPFQWWIPQNLILLIHFCNIEPNTESSNSYKVRPVATNPHINWSLKQHNQSHSEILIRSHINTWCPRFINSTVSHIVWLKW